MLVTKKVLHPAYYDSFSCIGNACEADCCSRNWDIHIDKRTYTEYKKIKIPEFAECVEKRVRRNKTMKADALYAKFILDEDSRCPFLNDEGLCDVYILVGPKYQSITCQMYPREMSLLMEGMLELSLSMSCPEAVRKALFNRDPMTFLLSEKELDTDRAPLRENPRQLFTDKDAPSPYIVHSWTLRDAGIDLMQNRQHSIPARIFLIGLMLSKVVELHDKGRAEEISDFAKSFCAAVQNGTFADVMDGHEENEVLRKTMRTIVHMGILTRVNNKENIYRPFRTLLQNFTRDLCGLEGRVDLKMRDLHDALYQYTNEKEPIWRKFLEDNSHIIENYMVNYIFSSIFPLTHLNGGLTPYQHFIVLAEQYAMIRILLCANLDESEEITERILTDVLCGVSMLYQHTNIPLRIAKEYPATKMDSLSHIYFLLQ